MKRIFSALLTAVLSTTCGTFAARANVAGGDGKKLPVTLANEGNRALLGNGIIAATIDTANARVISMKLRGREMVQTEGNRRDVYFSMAGGSSYEQPNHCVYSVTRQSADHVDISCKRIFAPGDKQPWDIDVHYVLRSGNSGLYCYAILDHPATYPDAGMGEWRTVWWMPTEAGKYLMERIYVDDTRHWEMPSLDDLSRAQTTGIKEIVKLTSGPWAGKFDCKYAYSAEYEKVGTYGHASDRNGVGAWMVLGGYDYFNDGPGKQDLAPASGIIHLHLYRNHYGAPGFTIKNGQAWKKIYGPWLLYVNAQKTGDAAWADAKAQVAAEKAAWPYAWLSTPEYPAASERGSVTGKLAINDALRPKVKVGGAWIGLALPERNGG